MNRRKGHTTARRHSRRPRAVERALGRSRVFGLLARALRYPDRELFAALQSGRWAAEVADAARQSGLGVRSSFLKALRRVPGTMPAGLADLQSEHTRLFSSGGACPHQESDYVASHTFQKADVMADVAGFYRAFGFQVSRMARELPDFLGTELEFLHAVGMKEAFARQQGYHAGASVCRRAQKTFLADHLSVWIGLFRHRVAHRGAGPFYVLLARLVEGFVKAQHVRPRAVAAPIAPVADVEGSPTCSGCS